MSVEIDYTIDKDLRIDSKGMSITRERMFFANNVMELYHSGILPMIKSSHPDDSRFRLKSSSVSSSGEKGGLNQFLWKGEYATQLGDGREWGVDKDPWDLGAQDVKRQTFTSSEVMQTAFDKDGKEFQLRNSANSPLKLTHEVYGMTLFFEFASKNKPTVNEQPVINDNDITIASQRIPRHCGLLLPMTYSLIVERDDLGNITRSYYNVSVQIKIITVKNKSWEKYVTNSGTLAIPRNSDQKLAQPLYTYSDPDTTNFENIEFKIKKKIGTLDDVIAAKKKYANQKTVEKHGAGWDKQSDKTKKAEAEKFHEQKFKELPWEEVKEPLALDENGHVDLELFENSKSKEQPKIYYFEYDLSNWRQYNLPKNAEGF